MPIGALEGDQAGDVVECAGQLFFFFRVNAGEWPRAVEFLSAFSDTGACVWSYLNSPRKSPSFVQGPNICETLT